MHLSSHSEKVAELYRAWASVYDESVAVGVPYRLEEGILVSAIHAESGEVILDLGCGTGRTIEKLISSGAEITGIDLSNEMLAIARKKFPGVSFIQGNVEQALPFSDGGFDKVVASLLFQFLPDLRAPLGEIVRVLRPEGTLYVTDFISDAPLDWSLVETRLPRKFKGSVGSLSTLRTLVDYVELFTHAGLRIARLEPLRVRENCFDILTESSYAKVQGNWASALFVLQKI